MTTTPARSPRLLLLSTVMLAVTGVALLVLPHGQKPTAPAVPTATSTTHAATATTAARSPATPPPTGEPVTGTARFAAPAVVAPSAVGSALPPHGEGVAGDRAVQDNLEAAWPTDLPGADERTLLAAGRALLRADATGVGRAQWPDVFGDFGHEVAPAFAAPGLRIQAAIARRDGSPDKAVVHLVWAGTDRGGTHTDLRITDWHFTRTTTSKGASTWTVQPRT
ncbi:hypothetical protein [Streptomyces adustus]